MRIAELSSRSGITIPSIKFYLREGLLAPGEATGRNQAVYTDEHLHRLRLIRALIDVGGLSIAAARDVLAAIDEPNVTGHKLLGAASYAVAGSPRRDPDSAAWQAARAEVVELARRRGWLVPDHAPQFDVAADAVAALRALGQDDIVAMLPRYADTMEQIAGQEVDLVVARGERMRMVEGVVTSTVLGEIVLNALRRLAQEDASARRLMPRDEWPKVPGRDPACDLPPGTSTAATTAGSANHSPR
ncbi:MerR family transcriptional regulator [Micromonospora sp. NPDC051296]|uniref:MerR family transcriptional regulator n=1 Tax=Micromonospora sp. NPDC051296 TaxID=3155046 RepID=UPI0034410BFF